MLVELSCFLEMNEGCSRKFRRTRALREAYTSKVALIKIKNYITAKMNKIVRCTFFVKGYLNMSQRRSVVVAPREKI